jgi:hypothetical protein
MMALAGFHEQRLAPAANDELTLFTEMLEG